MAQTGSVKPMSIAGRMVAERERCLGMSDLERGWRKQWLADQVLTSNEPLYVAEYWKERMNPIRRFYRAPLDAIFEKLVPALGAEGASQWRFITGRMGLFFLGVLGTHYYFKYNGNDWSKKGGWRVLRSKPMILPGHPEFPFKSQRKAPADFADRGFKKFCIDQNEKFGTRL